MLHNKFDFTCFTIRLAKATGQQVEHYQIHTMGMSAKKEMSKVLCCVLRLWVKAHVFCGVT